MKSKVAIVPCENYEYENVYRALETALDMLGGIDKFVLRDEKILLKPNLLVKAAPEKAATTHPAVFKAVGQLLKEGGYENIKYGDSSGNHVAGLERIAEGCGIKQVADALNIKAADFSEGETTLYMEGRTCREFIISKGIIYADAIINICKMKTHMLERITGAVKNTFGAVYGFNKGAFHVKFPDPVRFAKMLCDLNGLVKPRLHIMDGITAMEGNGPHSGTSVAMKVIIASDDPVALDSVFCNLVYLPPELVATNVYGQEYGIGTFLEENIEIIADNDGRRVITMAEARDLFGNKDFDVYRGTIDKGEIKQMRFLKPYLQKKPVINKNRCVACGICVQSCPVSGKAVNFIDKESSKEGGAQAKMPPMYDYNKCIRCYCCQEMCPEKAIEVKTPWLSKVIDRNWKL